MLRNYLPLESAGNNKFVRILQIIFGSACLIIAIAWTIMNITTFKSTGSVWVTIIFLLGFGYYEIIAGMGKAARFIEYDGEKMTMKRVSFLPARSFSLTEIDKIEIFPMTIHYYFKSGKRIILRLGATYSDLVSDIKKGTKKIANDKNIPVSFRKEEI